MKQVLVDTMPFKYSVFESADKEGRMTVSGIFQRADTKNENGRVYPSSLWDKLLPSLQDRVASRRMLGEADHPKDGKTSIIRGSHLITSLERSGNDIIGKAELLNTPNGLVLQEMFKSGVELGISSRGSGSTKSSEGVELVQDDFDLDTFDFVINPSTPGAYPKIVSEDTNTNNKSEDKYKMTGIESLKSIKALVEATKISDDLNLNELDDQLLSADIQLGRIGMEEAPLKDECDRVRGKISELRNEITVVKKKLSTERDELTTKLASATAVIEELVKRYKKDIKSASKEDTQKKIESAMVEAASAARDEIKKYSTAVMIIKKNLDEANRRLAGFKSNYDRVLASSSAKDAEIKELKSKLLVAEKMRSKNLIQLQVEHKLEGRADAATIRPLLEGCKTIEEVNKKYESIIAMIKRDMPSDLPGGTRRTGTLDKRVTAKENLTEDVLLARKLVTKLGGK